MLEFLSTASEFLKTTQGIFLSIGVICVSFWKGYNFIRERLFLPIKNHLDNTTEIYEKFPLIENALKELKPNGGDSIKDQLNRIEAFTRATMRLTNKAYWVSDSSGYCIEVSPELVHLLDASEIELLGSGWVNFISAEDKKEVKDEWESAVKEKRDFRLVYSVSREKRTKKVSAIAIPIRNGENNVIGFLGWLDENV